MAHGSHPRVRAPHYYAAAALCLLTLAAYSNSFHTGLALDSRQAILSDERIRDATSHNIDLVLNHTYWWPYDESGLYRPLTTLSYLFNYAVLGGRDRPAGYHVVNLLLHMVNVLLVYALSTRLVRRFWPAVFIAAVWAVHPVLTEGVTNIVGRADLLAGFGVLAGFWMYLRGGLAGLAGLLLASAVGVFSKESAVVLPGVIVLYELACGRQFRRAAVGCLVALAPVAAMLLQRTAVLADALPTHIPFTDNPLAGTGFWTAKLTAVQVMGRYLGLLVWPARLSADYSYAQVPLSHGRAGDWLAWVAVAAVAVAAILSYRWNRVVFFFAAFAFLTLLPSSNLLFPAGTIMAERLLYLPAVGFAACLVLALYRTRFAPAVLCLVVAALAARTWMRNPDWRDDFTMAKALVRTSPASFKAHRLLAYELFEAHVAIDQVISEAEKSLAPLESLPDSENTADTWRLAAGYYYTKGGYQRSAQLLLRCLAIVKAEHERQPAAVYAGASDVYRMLAADYQKMGKSDDAAVTLMTAQLMTGDLGFRKPLLDLYASGLDSAGCAIVPGPAGPALNPACAIVHRHLCAALMAAGRSSELPAYGCR